MNKVKLEALIRQAKENHAKRMATLEASGKVIKLPEREETKHVLTETQTHHPTIQGINLNPEQLAALELGLRGKSFNLIGAAGTGKTTTTREIIAQVVRMAHVSPISFSTKYLQKDQPGLVVLSFTNKAVNNLRKNLPESLKPHCLTYHKLLEYKPVRYQESPGDPTSKTTMKFEPSYNAMQKLPHISVIFVEEGSMVAEELHTQRLLAALPNPELTQFIFLGDLNQLPPIFGPSILGFSLLDLPTIELKHVYRQALQSPIIDLAHKIREGKGIGNLDQQRVDDRGEHGKVTIRPWLKRLESTAALKTVLGKFLLPMFLDDKFDPNETAVLCPFNKSFGTVELNRHIADALGKKRGAEVFEVIGRYQRSYWAVGDRVLHDRQECIIIRIEPTPGYDGPIPVSPSRTLDRWGKDRGNHIVEQAQHAKTRGEEEKILKELNDDILDKLPGSGDGEEKRNIASHRITLEFVDSGATKSIDSAGDINSLLFSYVITVHKSQGSEWKRVILLFHWTHNSMMSRELVYTAVTRARQELIIICEPDRKEVYNTLTRAAKSPEIHGVTLKEKAAYFSAKKKTMQRMASRQKDLEDNSEDIN